MNSRWFLAAWLALLIPTFVSAEAVKDREGAVRHDRAALESDPRWNYNNVAAGFAEGKRTGKPVLVVLRCVPCLACAGIDAQVLLKETELAPLLDQFICVRVINANALDLARFQFDYDLSFSTLFFNSDGTLYGRYGSWTHQKNAQDKTTAGFRRTLEAVLDLHRGYPANRPQLLGKQGVAGPYQTPIDIPTLTGKYRLELDWNGKVVPSCVHCHQIGDAMRSVYRKDSQPIPVEWIYPWPAPDTVGFTLLADQTAQVAGVTPGSPAGLAGLRTGDQLLRLAGQVIVSSADVSWVLHRAPDTAAFPVLVRREGKETELELKLAAGWRRKTDISQRAGVWSMRGMATGGLVLEDVPDAERSGLSLTPTQLALRVQFVGQYGKHAAGKKAGFQKGDILIDCDGQADRLTESQWFERVLQTKKVGATMQVTVLRGTDKVKLQLPSQ